MRRAALAAVCAAALLLLGQAEARRRPATQLLIVLTPAGKAPAPAHPDVNVVVRFTGNADPSTFRARLAGRDITERFSPVLEQGKQIGVRATIPRDRVRVGRRRTNRLRLLVRGRAPAKGRPARQIVRVRFRASEAQNLAPVAVIEPESEIIFPDVPLSFDGRASFDPEFDALTYYWEFGEGGPASDVAPAHVYASADVSRTVTLTVSDGQASTTASVALRACPQAPGSTPGAIEVEAGAPLEFGAVAPGASATRTFTVRNTATDPTAQMGVCIGWEGAAFSVSPERLDLAPGAEGQVTVTFAPPAEGHAHATLVLVSSAAERPFFATMVRGYGGSAPGTGPTLASAPAFYDTRDGIRGFLPSGAPITVNGYFAMCAAADGGFGSGDVCVADGDCSANGGVCPQSGVCSRGDRMGQACTQPRDCPIRVPQEASCPDVTYGYDCPWAESLDVEEMCGDGAGGLFLLTEGTFTDPMPPEDDYPLEGTLLRIGLDDNGGTTERAVLGRTTEDTVNLACDRFAADAGGRVYLAETRAVPESGDCFRDTKEVLVGVRKNSGGTQTVLGRIDAAQGLSDCDDIDNTVHIEVTSDGSQAFASFDSNGLWRVRPSPLQFLDSSFFEDTFRVHPDGSVIFATVRDAPSIATVSVFKVTPAQVAAGPLPTSGLVPCATFQLPNNRLGSRRASSIYGVGVSPPVVGSRDATILVSVLTPSLTSSLPPETCPGLKQRIENLRVRATVAFSSPADATSCTPVGLVNLEPMEKLTF